MSRALPHVVVVAYHAPAALDRSLAALAGELAVSVIDNSSSAQVAAVAERHGAAYFDCGSNRGFAGGVNAALERLADDPADVLLLNPDAVITPAAVAALTAFLDRPEHRRVGALTPRLYGPDGVEQRALWPFPSPLRMCLEAVGLGHLPSRERFAVGAVLLLRREALDAVGAFDERYFLYAEETDWQRRARSLGWSTALAPTVRAEHAGAGTSADERRRELLFHAAQETYIRKWYGASGWAIYRVAACAGAGGRAVVLRAVRRRDAARRMRLYLRGPRRCAALEHD